MRSWPSTTRTTCRPKSPLRLRNRASGSKWRKRSARSARLRKTRANDPRARPFRVDPGALRRPGAGRGAAGRRPAWRRLVDGGGASGGVDPVRAHRRRIRLPDPGLCHVRLLGSQRGAQLPFRQAHALQDLRRVGQPRGLDAAMGADSGSVRLGGGGLRSQPAAGPGRSGALGAGHDRGRLPRLHLVYVEPLRASGGGARRWTRTEPVVAGSGPCLPPAVSLPRLRWLLHGLLVRHRGAD